MAHENEELEPKLPTFGPCGVEMGGPCRLSLDHKRVRKTGPCFALTVMRCRAHNRGFTLYPPGHVPYGREAIAPVGIEGQWMQIEQSDEPYAETVFDAALDANEGRAWARQSAGGSDRWWSTQGRRLRWLLRWLGLDPEASERRRHALSEVLVVALLLLAEHAKAIAARPGYRSRGAAICAVIAELPRAAVAVDRLAAVIVYAEGEFEGDLQPGPELAGNWNGAESGIENLLLPWASLDWVDAEGEGTWSATPAPE